MKTREDYDYKKIVEEFERWLKKEYVPIETKGHAGYSGRVEVQDKFLTIKRRHLILTVVSNK